jgi:hypothetical protein
VTYYATVLYAVGAAQGGRLVGFAPAAPIHWLNKIETTRPLAAELGLASKVVLTITH